MARLAARQHTMVSVAQLRDVGIGEEGVRWRRHTGRLHFVRRSVYSTVPPVHRPPLAAEAAALLACGDGAVLSHRSAAAMWGLTKRDPSTVDVTVPTRRRNRPGLRIHRAADATDVRVVDHLSLTSPYRSIVDLAPHLSERETERLVSEALIQRRITDAEAQTLVEQPHITRSEAERLFVELIHKAGLPPPQTNVRVAGYEVDAFWPDHRLAVEIDGYRFHGHRLAFDRDREKGLALARAGVELLRIGWRQLTGGPERIVATVAVRLSRGS